VRREEIGLPTRGFRGVIVAQEDDHETATVLILGDSIVGSALELLLRSADLDVRFLDEPSLGRTGLFDGVGLLLITPGMSAGLREDLMKLLGDRALAERIPILELTSDDREMKEESGRSLLPWPSSPEDLKRWIQEALLASNRTVQDD
jgi:hypothetical protein